MRRSSWDNNVQNDRAACRNKNAPDNLGGAGRDHCCLRGSGGRFLYRDQIYISGYTFFLRGGLPIKAVCRAASTARHESFLDAYALAVQF
jgi:hypothetical protein